MSDEYEITIVFDARDGGDDYTVLTRTTADGHAAAVSWGQRQAREQFPHAAADAFRVTARLTRPQQKSLFE